MFNLTFVQATAKPGISYTYVSPKAGQLTIVQPSNGGPGAVYTYITPKGPLFVTDVSHIQELSQGHQAIVISYMLQAWLYRFDVGQDPPQDPIFTISENDEMSLTGNGSVVPFIISSAEEMPRCQVAIEIGPNTLGRQPERVSRKDARGSRRERIDPNQRNAIQ